LTTTGVRTIATDHLLGRIKSALCEKTFGKDTGKITYDVLTKRENITSTKQKTYTDFLV